MPSHPHRPRALLVLPAVLASGLAGVLVLAACGSSGGSPGPSGSAPTGAGSTASVPARPVTGANTEVGIEVEPKFGQQPSLTIPSGPAPSTLTDQVLTAGTGATVRKGELLIANYLGQTWAPKDGKPNVFDSSFARNSPAAFVIGAGQVIPGWDKTLVGKKLGSRVLLTIPPVDGYGSSGRPEAGIRGTDTLVFVVDLVDAFPPDASAPGTAVRHLPKGWPKIDNVPAKEPKVLGTAGVAVPDQPRSLLVVKGSGDPIDAAKTLVVQAVEADLATGQDSQSTWGQVPQTAPAQNVLGIATALKGQNVGSRAIVLLPQTAAVPGTDSGPSQAAQPPEVLILDVVGQF